MKKIPEIFYYVKKYFRKKTNFLCEIEKKDLKIVYELDNEKFLMFIRISSIRMER